MSEEKQQQQGTTIGEFFNGIHNGIYEIEKTLSQVNAQLQSALKSVESNNAEINELKAELERLSESDNAS